MDYECGDKDDVETFLATTVNTLNDLSFNYTLTRTINLQVEVDPFKYTKPTLSSELSDATVYTTQLSRYYLGKFYGVIVDTGALRSSIVG